MPFKRNYEIIKDAPKEIEWEQYCEKAMEEYQMLLQDSPDNERVFQNFFEENPSFLPGGLELFGHSGHYPYMDALITQPEIGSVFRRKPDFVWLANDSLSFVPVFIEIEKPSKKIFNADGTTNAEFNQALGQIHEWKYLLNQPTNIQLLYDAFNLPLDLRDKMFKPQYLLVYGRREEYENDKMRTGIRASKKTDDIDIMSFDRLRPLSDYRQFITCKVSGGRYRVQHISPTYRYRADCAEELVKQEGFFEKIECMKYTSEERKAFLKERYAYWCEFGKKNFKGVIRSQEGE